MNQTVIPNLLWWKRRWALAITIAVVVAANFLCDETSAATICGSRADQAALRSLSLKTGRTVNTFIEFLGNGHTMIKPKKKCDDVCVSAGCVHTASMVLKTMDTNVDPCDNFYKFACGGFLKNTVIPDDWNRISFFDIAMDKIQKELKASIESKIEDNEPKPFKLVKNLYKSCMNTTAIEAQGLEALKTKLKELGGWPVVDGDLWNERDFDWISSVHKFRDTGFAFDYFIAFNVNSDFKNNTKHVIYLDPASLGRSREYLSKGMDNEIVKAYYKNMVDIAVLLGAKRECATIELKESLLFEMKLANISLPNEQRRNWTKLHNPMSIRELGKKYPSVPWREYVSKLLPSSISIDENEITIVSEPSYLSEFEKLMADPKQKRVQANYVMWRAAADSDVRKKQLAYSTVSDGETKRASRWRECVKIVSSKLAISVNAMYVRKYFNKETKHNAEEIVRNIRSQLKITLSTVEWMDNVTRQSALEKVAAMSIHVAYPSELLDDNKLEEFYAKLELTDGNYFNNIMNLNLFQTNWYLSQLREPVNKTHWVKHATTASADGYYTFAENGFELYAGILQGVFYSSDRPTYMNYGAIGFFIGHEMFHGFDDQGGQYDKDGNVVDWWAPSAKQEFLKRAECIIQQYGNYTVEEVGLNLNGINTQGENIADNGGIEVAYLAYNQWVDRNSPEAKLRGLDYTPEQMFWISAAIEWCSIETPEEMKNTINTDFHSPREFRILGTFSNMPEFSQDFNCPIGSKMNPKNKCSFW